MYVESIGESMNEQGPQSSGFGAFPLIGSLSWVIRAGEQEQQTFLDKPVQALKEGRRGAWVV